MDNSEAPEGLRAIMLPYLQVINSTPDLLWLLYDAALLPEQVTTIQQVVAMAAVVEAYRMGQASASCEIE